ncbi:methionine sulfoxide reductase A domain protein, partial [Vibrio harveyi]
MRSIIIGAMLLFLTACAQTRLPDSVNVTDWQDFGKQSALDG